jgi:hypothetical protein
MSKMPNMIELRVLQDIMKYRSINYDDNKQNGYPV